MVNNKQDFNYYIHKTSVSDYNSFFENGLIDYDSSFKIESTMTRISDKDIEDGRLESIMKELRDGDENVFLIKIPKSYFPDRLHRDGTFDVPIPLFYEAPGVNIKTLKEDIYPILIPNLIQGCYNRQKEFIQNENYCPVFDPSGLKFAYEQLEPMHRQHYYRYDDYKKRNEASMKELYSYDKSSNLWEPFIKYYATKFGITDYPEYDILHENIKSNKTI